MRIRVELVSEKKNIYLQRGFLRDFQAALIYRHLPPESADFLHNRGFQWGSKKFKLFSFTPPLERYKKFDPKRKTFIYPSKITVLISSPVLWIMEEIASGLIKSNEFDLSGNLVVVSSIVLRRRKL